MNKSSLALVSLVSLTKPNTTCQLPSFHHQNKVKYVGYVEKINSVVACLEDNPDCFTFDGLSWNPLPTQRKPMCSHDSFQAIPQGLVNVKGSKPGQEASWQCQAADHMITDIVIDVVSEIYDGQAWVELDIEDANIINFPIKRIGISKWTISYPQTYFFIIDNDNTFWWSLNYESRKWVRSTKPEDDDIEGVDWSNFPQDVIYRGNEEGHLGFYWHTEQVYQTKEINGTWTPVEGVFLSYKHVNANDPFFLDLVPKSFSIGCLDDY